MLEQTTVARFRELKPGMELTVTRRYRQSPAKVFAALTDPERIADWMGVTWLGDTAPLKVGSSFSYRFANSDMTSSGRVVALDQPRILEHTWFENIPPAAVIRWTVEPEGDGCLLTVTQTYPGKDDAPRNGAGWTMLMDGLEAWLDQRPASPSESWRSLRDRFAREMGPSATRDGRRLEKEGRPVVQFTRLVDLPVAETWAWLTEPDQLSKWLGKVALELEPGGLFNVTFDIADASMNGTIVEIDPPHHLSMIWREPWFERDEVTLALDLAPYEGATVLTLTHTFPAAYDPHDYLPGWHELLDALDTAVDGAPKLDWSSPERKRNWDKLQAVYKAVAAVDA